MHNFWLGETDPDFRGQNLLYIMQPQLEKV